MPQILKKVLEHNPALFLGCSLGADRTCKIIEECSPQGTQFAFLELPMETNNKDNFLSPHLKKENGELWTEWKERKDFIEGTLGLMAIWYPYGKHEEAYEAFFNQLCKDCNISNNSVDSTSLSHPNYELQKTNQAIHSAEIKANQSRESINISKPKNSTKESLELSMLGMTDEEQKGGFPNVHIGRKKDVEHRCSIFQRLQGSTELTFVNYAMTAFIAGYLVDEQQYEGDVERQWLIKHLTGENAIRLNAILTNPESYADIDASEYKMYPP